ncbi:MAG: hypothetical protein V6Z82_05100 [Flavobacteriales bacterium]
MSMSLEYAQSLTAEELISLSPDVLMELQKKAQENLERAELISEFIAGSITLKYQWREKTVRHEQSKETGTVRFIDGDVYITSNIPKRILWDQKKLAEIFQRLKDSGEKPGDFLDVTYKVSERKYNAWPESLRQVFTTARTLKTGKPVYQLQAKEEK